MSAGPDPAAGGRLYLGGRWQEPSTAATTTVVSPATEEPVGSAAVAAPADVDAAVAAAREAIDSGPWAATTPEERIEVIGRIGEAYGARRRELASTITSEMGAPISFSKMAQAMLPWSMWGAFAGLAAQHTWEERRPGLYGSDVIVRKEPVGVVGAIVPWNMPQFLMVAKLAPALLAGNAVVVKPALETPLDALILAEVLDEVGLPPGVVSILPGDGAVGAHLAAHPDVDMVSFTGSTAVGRQVGAVCGGALKRAHLELGGKSAAIVLDDADAAAVAEGIKVAGFMNSGQACVAQTRILVPEARRAEVVEALAAMVEGVAVGDPQDKATEIGPLVTRRQQERVRGHIDGAVREGARLVVGGVGAPSGRRPGVVHHSHAVRRRRQLDAPSPRRRSSVPCSPCSATPTTPMRCASPTTPPTACRARCGPPTSTAASTSPGGSGRAPSG